MSDHRHLCLQLTFPKNRKAPPVKIIEKVPRAERPKMCELRHISLRPPSSPPPSSPMGRRSGNSHFLFDYSRHPHTRDEREGCACFDISEYIPRNPGWGRIFFVRAISISARYLYYLFFFFRIYLLVQNAIFKLYWEGRC